MAPKPKAEKRYLKRIGSYRDSIHLASSDAPQEGFEYFAGKTYRQKSGRSMLGAMFLSGGFVHLLQLLSIMARYMRSIMRGRSECFKDLEPYFDELKSKGSISMDDRYLDTYPNPELFEELREYARTKWGAQLGFTSLEQQLIFRDKGVLFDQVLIVIQEMDRQKIQLAPRIEAGEEVQRVYDSLGHAANDIARWLRDTKGLKCQSNHPLGGLVNTTPLAGKAGLGQQGLDGLLITPEFGKRVRIAPIFLSQKIFAYTDTDAHSWIEQFCERCRRCQRACPTGAISGSKHVYGRTVEGLGLSTCIDRERCFPQFNRTLGCSICIKSCPFSKGGDTYRRLYEAHKRKEVSP